MAANIALKVNGVHKTFKVPHERYSSLKQNAIHLFSKKSYSVLKAVNDISFEVKTGEFFGIVGRNGCGKSTLLKMLAGIYIPTKGTIDINGSLSPFIELGVGFNPELSGRDNVFLNGSILGLSRKQVMEKLDSIVAFGELEEFIDQKLKNFSSGMQVRLAFSIAIQAQSDILLIDEVLAVGDAAFQQKCFDVFARLKREGKTIILVTHDMSAVTQFCDRALVMDGGKITAIGKPSEIAEKYQLLNFNTRQSDEPEDGTKRLTPSAPVITAAQTYNLQLQKRDYFDFGEAIVVEFDYNNPKSLPLHFGFQIFSDKDTYCFGTNSRIGNANPTTKKSGSVSIELQPKLLGGNYYITIACMNEETTSPYSFKPRAITFRIAQSSEIQGICDIPHTWKVK